MFSEKDQYWMNLAIDLAKLAQSHDEVPVGAVLVLNDTLIAKGFNQPIATCDPTAHAEIVALRSAGEILNNYRLLDATMYVTLEPCLMCAGALVHARIKRLVFGAYDLKAGVVSTHENVFDKPYLNHRVTYEGGLMQASCALLLSDFFKARRI